MRAALYTRVSTEDQARKGVSIDGQERLLRERAELEGWEVVEVYTDDGYSGTTMDRPALRRLVDDARAGRFDLVAAYHIDRISRRVQHALHLIEDVFVANGISVVLLQQPLDLSAATGRATLGFMSVVAQLERDMITERTRLGKAQAAKEGRWRGGPRPFGYRYDPGSKQLVPIPEEADTVREIVRLYLHQGWGTTKIAEYLDRTGRSTARGGPWSRAQVWQLLTSLYIAGMQGYRGEVYPAPVTDPIIDRETWDRIQAIIRDRSASMTHGRSYRYLLTGLARCGVCGAPIRGVPKHASRDRIVYYYACQNRSDRDQRRRHRCTLGYFQQPPIDEQVVRKLKEAAATLIKTEILTSLNEPEETARQRRTDIENASARLRQAEQAKGRLLDAYMSGRVDATEFARRDDELAAKLDEIAVGLARLQADEPKLQRTALRNMEIADLLCNFDALWPAMTRQEQVDLVHKVVRKAIIKPGGLVEIELG